MGKVLENKETLFPLAIGILSLFVKSMERPCDITCQKYQLSSPIYYETWPCSPRQNLVEKSTNLLLHIQAL